MTLLEWSASQLINGDDRAAFRLWLINHNYDANKNRTAAEWSNLWGQFMYDMFGPVAA